MNLFNKFLNKKSSNSTNFREKLDLSDSKLNTLSKKVLKYSNLKELDLSGNKLTHLPEFLKELKFLEKINVSNNLIKEFPKVLLSFKNLRELNIAGNKIREFNFINDYSAFSKLEKLNIADNSAKKLPSWLWKLEYIKELYINGIVLQEFPKELGNLRTLEVLSIAGCQIKELPESIGYLKKLTVLYAENNLLKQLPHTFKQLDQCKELNLGSNKFQDFPNDIFNLLNLEYLDMRNNDMLRIEAKVKVLHKLEYLDVSQNRLKNLPDDFEKLNLKQENFYFSQNHFSRAVMDKAAVLFLSAAEKGKKQEEERQWRREKEESNLVRERAKRKKKLQEEAKRRKRQGVKINKESKPKSNLELYFKMFMFFVLFMLIPLSFPVLGHFIEEYERKSEIKEEKEFKLKEIETDKIKADKNENKEAFSKEIDEILRDKKVKKGSEKEHRDYLLAEKNLKKSISNVLSKNKEVYVYTNDKANLKLTLRPNAKFHIEGYQDSHSDKRKAKYINKFLNNSRYGFSVDIDNGREVFTQMWLHDSIIPARLLKKFRVVRYYKMTEEEKVYNKERDVVRERYGKKARRDVVFAVNRGIVDFDELRNKRFWKKTRRIFTPKNIDITRKDNFFYFTSLNGNVSKEEFLEAVEEFKIMFITKGSPSKYCRVRTLKITP